MIDRLRELAERATPGPWGEPKPDEDDHFIWHLVPPHMSHSMGVKIAGLHNAAYIAAANPEVILKLLDVVEAAKRYRSNDCSSPNVSVRHYHEIITGRGEILDQALEALDDYTT